MPTSPSAVPLLTDDDLVADRAVPSSLGVLLCERGLFPLVAVDIDASVSGLIGRTTLLQRFVNHYAEPIEATYVFPLPDRAAVTSFTARIGDRTIEGRLEERGAARQRYDAAIASGHQAAIAEEDRRDCFTVRVGNLRPAEEAEITLVLDGPVAFDRGEATYRFPLVIAPRYIPGAPLDGESVGDGTAPDTDAVPDASRITPPRLAPGSPNPVALTAGVTILGPAEQRRELRCSLPATHAAGDDTSADTRPSDERDGVVVRLEPGQRLDRDLIVRWRPAVSDEPVAMLTVDPAEPDRATGDADHATIGVTFTPPVNAGAAARGRDVVVVLDRSGSMGGWKMVAARRAAARVVDTLTADDRFAVIAFDHTVDRPSRLPEGLVAATDHHRFAGVEFLSRLDARGGTELDLPLTTALDTLAAVEPDSTRRRCIVLVTDGQVGGEDHILRSVGQRLGDVAIYTIGVDRAVNAGFLQRLAGLGGGRCELVESEDRLDEAFATIRSRIGRPVLRDVGLEVTGATLVTETLTPAWQRDCYEGAPLTVMARVGGIDDTAAVQVTVTGTAPDGSAVRLQVPVQRAGNPALTSCWARARVRDLEDAWSAGRAGAAPEDIVSTSLRFGVLSRFTAFVAVDTSVTVDSVDPIVVVQPVEEPSGWDLAAGGAPAPAMAMAAMPAMSVQPQATDVDMETLADHFMAMPAVVAPEATRTKRRGLRGRLTGAAQAPIVPSAAVADRGGADVPDAALSAAYRARIEELLDRVAGALDDAGAAALLSLDARELADDVATVTTGELVTLLRRLAEELARSPFDAAAIRRTVDEVRAAASGPVPTAPATRRDGDFWS